MSFRATSSSRVCDALMHVVTALGLSASAHSLYQRDKYFIMFMCGLRVVFHSSDVLSAPNPGRSHGLTQLWVLCKDTKTGAVDKASLQKVRFEEELYQVTVRIRCLRVTDTRFYHIGMCGCLPLARILTFTPTHILAVTLVVFA